MIQRSLCFFLTCGSLVACTTGISELGHGTDQESGGSPGSGGENDDSPRGGTRPVGTGGTTVGSGGTTARGGSGKGGSSSGKGGSSSGRGGSATGGKASSAGQPATTGGSAGLSEGDAGEGATGGTGNATSVGGAYSTGGVGEQPECVSYMDMNQGDDPPQSEDCPAIGAALKEAHDNALLGEEVEVEPLAGTWATGSGTERIELVLDAAGNGTLRFGEASEFPSFEAGDETFLTTTGELDAVEVSDYSHVKIHQGFAYSIIAESGRGSELSFHVVGLEAFDGWCAEQAPVLSPNAKACYACMYDEGYYTFSSCGLDQRGCFAGKLVYDPEERVHCGRVELCVVPYHKACLCNADGCFANLTMHDQLTDYPFTLQRDPVDPSILRLASLSELRPKVTKYLEKQE